MLKSQLGKVSTAKRLFSHLPDMSGSASNLVKAGLYNIKPKAWKSPEISHLPVSYTIYINTICNYRCSFCFLITDQHKGDKGKNISLKKFKAIVEHPQNRFASRVTIGGGEPMLHPKVFEFIKILKDLNKVVSIYTNGSLIHRNMDKTLNSDLDYLNISHYDDKFSDIQDSIAEFLSKKTRPITRLSKILTNSSLGDMEKVLSLAMEINFDSVIFQNYYAEYERDSEHVIHSSNTEFHEEKARLIKKYRNIEIIWPNLHHPDSEFNCQNISLNATYDSDGNQAPCCFQVPPARSYGNIFKDADSCNTKEMIRLRVAYQTGTKEANFCKNCYFRCGLGNRYR